jgi:DNA-binding LytR/AlgR family response regulator
LRIVGVASNGVEAVALAERLSPQILFLDIEMPGLNGLEVAQQIGDRAHIVFITAYDAHAVRAFEQGAIDYVLKPYNNGRLALALKRLRDRLADGPPPIADLLRELTLAARPKEYLRWLKASRGSEVDLVMVNEIAYLQAEAKYTTVYTALKEAIIRTSIKELASELDPSQFWQIHRSTIVNVEAIESVTRNLSGISVKLRARPERLPVSSAHRHLFKHM